MQTLSEILERAQKLGVKCSSRTFWKYYSLGLLPSGEKIPGRGNVVYFPDDAHIRLCLIHFFSQGVEVPLRDMTTYPWHRLEPASRIWPGSFASEIGSKWARHEYGEAKKAAFVRLMARFLERTEEVEEGRRGKKTTPTSTERKKA